ncbi:MAG: hypothetical protein NTW08_08020 [Gammaproteobacteria bacterium]|nr:hypothetical protein [Gammaproteobacteria bacterium]
MLNQDRNQRGSQDARRHEKQAAAHPSIKHNKTLVKSNSTNGKMCSRGKRK